MAAGSLELPHTRNIFHQHYTNVQDRYKLVAEIGQGQFGTVFACMERSTKTFWACKCIRKSKLLNKQDVADVRQEVAALQEVAGHPSIISLKETVEDSKRVFLIMELCSGGDLYGRLTRRQKYSEKEAAQVFCTVASVVEHCHNRGVMHRDLKPENIMLCSKDSDVHVKVIDFGLAVYFRPEEKFEAMAGSAYYVAPEVIKGEYGPEADIWSIGVILYILLCGWPPFCGDQKEEIYEAIMVGDLNTCRGPWANISDPAKDLVRRILMQDPRERLTLDQIFEHPWLQDYCSIQTLEPCEAQSVSGLRRINSGESLSSSQLSPFSPQESSVWPVCETSSSFSGPQADGLKLPNPLPESGEIIHCS